MTIAEAGAISPLVNQLTSGTARAKKLAADTILYLSFVV
eukprot:CAMPEP_0197297184 /NCGR_PEP_ID=MMETSP0890-20130614/40384_1 /TAXON_ID=44058 ORGANISM="Aureoumbra lagunensis, Strain CCMP1510" /NCGR_SAMPLE_ID=MMETSP0890 /ASSEMBLY_ACC=CAM_ASM_000533 /LENGTH=38 /DNA_ID= /DNA_START= /DNA_END= /DNA_ORIENTATION=